MPSLKSYLKECKVLKRFRKYILGREVIRMWKCNECGTVITQMMVWERHSCYCGSKNMHDFDTLTKMESWRLGWRILIKGY